MATRFSTTLTVNGLRVEGTIPRGSKAWQLANSIFNPLGPSPCKAWLAVTKLTLDQISSSGSTPCTIEWKQDTTTLDSGSITESLEREFNGMYFIGAERILHGAPSDPNALFLAEFADARYLANKKSDSGSLVANIRSYANTNDYLTGTTTVGTWEQLVQSLWNSCGVLGTYPSLPGGLPVDGVPQNHWMIGLSAYRCLCVVLDQLDCALRFNPFEAVGSQFSIIQLGSSQTLSANNDTLKWNGQPESNVAAHVASTVKVYFHYHRKGYGQERDTELANNWAYNGTGTTVSVSTSVTGSSGTVPLWDDLPAILDETGNQSNTAACATRAANRASRYATRNSITFRHRIHRGILATDYLPGGSVRAVLWRNWNDGQNPDGSTNPFGGTCTEFVCCRDLVHGFKPDNSGGVIWLDRNNDTPEWDQYSGLDLGKHSYPTYPRIANIVQVNHVGYSEGEVVNPTGTNNLHKGRVRRWVNNELQTLDDCWILFVDEYDTKLGNIPAKQGDCFGPGRLSGITTDTHEGGSATLPVYTVRKGGTTGSSSGEIVVFELTQALTSGLTTTASAYLCELGAGVWTADNTQPITVACGYSDIGRLWTAPIGARGLAYQRLDGVYEIIYMTRYDMFVPFQATVNRGSSDESFSATAQNGFQHGDIEPSSFVVWDASFVFPRVGNGAYGLAVWNDDLSRYDCVYVQQLAITGKAKINNATTGLQFGDVDNISVTNFVTTSPSPFNLTPSPLPTSAYNKFGLRGKDDDEVWLEWDNHSSVWVVVQIRNNEKSYVVKSLANGTKGTTPVNCEVYVNGVATGRIIACQPLGAAVTANKWCSAWTEPSTGITYVAPWECG